MTYSNEDPESLRKQLLQVRARVDELEALTKQTNQQLNAQVELSNEQAEKITFLKKEHHALLGLRSGRPLLSESLSRRSSISKSSSSTPRYEQSTAASSARVKASSRLTALQIPPASPSRPGSSRAKSDTSENVAFGFSEPNYLRSTRASEARRITEDQLQVILADRAAKIAAKEPVEEPMNPEQFWGMREPSSPSERFEKICQREFPCHYCKSFGGKPISDTLGYRRLTDAPNRLGKMILPIADQYRLREAALTSAAKALWHKLRKEHPRYQLEHYPLGHHQISFGTEDLHSCFGFWDNLKGANELLGGCMPSSAFFTLMYNMRWLRNAHCHRESTDAEELDAHCKSAHHLACTVEDTTEAKVLEGIRLEIKTLALQEQDRIIEYFPVSILADAQPWPIHTQIFFDKHAKRAQTPKSTVDWDAGEEKEQTDWHPGVRQALQAWDYNHRQPGTDDPEWMAYDAKKLEVLKEAREREAKELAERIARQEEITRAGAGQGWDAVEASNTEAAATPAAASAEPNWGGDDD